MTLSRSTRRLWRYARPARASSLQVTKEKKEMREQKKAADDKEESRLATDGALVRYVEILLWRG